MSYQIDAKNVRETASRMGWDHVLRSICPVLTEIIDQPAKRMACPGPGHTSKHGDAFRLYPDFRQSGGGVCNSCGSKADGFALIQWITGWAFPKVLQEVHAVVGGQLPETYQSTAAVAPPARNFTDDALKAKKLETMWHESVGLGHPEAEPARLYFAKRGLIPLTGPLAELRFHAALPYYEQVVEGTKQTYKLVGDFPAILAMVRQPDGQRVTLHRTYLSPDGYKAPVPAPKKQMPAPSYKSVVGAMIRLDPIAPVLHVTEGLENALAVRNITAGCGHSTGSCLNATLLAKVIPPEGVKLVCLWGDHDTNGAGRRAVDEAHANLRTMNIRSVIVMPTFACREGDETLDWLDVVNRLGVEGVRAHELYRTLSRLIERDCVDVGIPAAASSKERAVS